MSKSTLATGYNLIPGMVSNGWKNDSLDFTFFSAWIWSARGHGWPRRKTAATKKCAIIHSQWFDDLCPPREYRRGTGIRSTIDIIDYVVYNIYGSTYPAPPRKFYRRRGWARDQGSTADSCIYEVLAKIEVESTWYHNLDMINYYCQKTATNKYWKVWLALTLINIVWYGSKWVSL